MDGWRELILFTHQSNVVLVVEEALMGKPRRLPQVGTYSVLSGYDRERCL